MSILGNNPSSGRSNILDRNRDPNDEPRDNFQSREEARYQERQERDASKYFDNNSSVRFKILEFQMFGVVKQQPIFVRPFTVKSEGKTVQQLTSKIIQDRSTARFNPNNVASYVGGLMQVSERGAESMLNERWFSEGKFIFRMRISAITDLHDTETVTYVMGSTNHNNLIHLGGDEYQIPNDMLFNISSVIECNVVDVRLPGSRDVYHEQIQHVYDIVTGKDMFHKYTQRPLDMFGYMKKDRYLNKSKEGNSPFDYGGVNINVRSSFSEMGKSSDHIEASKALNNVGTYYLSTMMREGFASNAINKYESSVGSYYGDEDVASDLVYEPCISENDFIAFLNERSKYNRFKGSFSYGVLMDVDPRGAEDCEIVDIKRGGRDDNLRHVPKSGERWDGRDLTTRVAYSMLESTVALASQLGWTKIRMVVDGLRLRSFEDELVKIVPPFHSILKVDMQDLEGMADVFRNLFMTTIYNAETRNGKLPIFAEIIIDLYGDSRILLGIDGDRPEWFTMPTVAKSYSNPVISDKKEVIDRNKDLFGQLIRDISDERNYR